MNKLLIIILILGLASPAYCESGWRGWNSHEFLTVANANISKILTTAKANIEEVLET